MEVKNWFHRCVDLPIVIVLIGHGSKLFYLFTAMGPEVT